MSQCRYRVTARLAYLDDNRPKQRRVRGEDVGKYRTYSQWKDDLLRQPKDSKSSTVFAKSHRTFEETEESFRADAPQDAIHCIDKAFAMKTPRFSETKGTSY